jgi:hypothetical protein
VAGETSWKVIIEPEIDEAYELVLRRDAEADQYRGIGGTILWEKPEYRTRDLFIPHSDRPGLWRFCKCTSLLFIYNYLFASQTVAMTISLSFRMGRNGTQFPRRISFRVTETSRGF